MKLTSHVASDAAGSTRACAKGIRALLIDKDKAPKWSPDEIERVPPSLVQEHFAPLADPALELDV